MLDGLQPQKLDAGALSVGALARLMREERQRQPDKKIHLVLDDRAAEAVGWAGGAAWCRQVGAAHIYALGADVPDTDDVLRVVVTNDVEKARQQYGACVVAAAPAFAAPFHGDDATLPCLVSLASDAFPVRPWEAPADWRAGDLPERRRKGLKDLATELAALCADLRIDAAGNVWALGDTAGAVGAAVDAQLQQGGGRRAALVLLDRTADLSVVGAPPDGALERIMAHFSGEGPLLSAAADLTKAYDAPWVMNACDRALLRRVVATASHDDALDLLNEAVAERLQLYGIAPPPQKKRGRGAALAAHLEALLKGAPQPASSAFDVPDKPLRAISDIAPLGVAVVEATQRTAKRRTSLEDVLALDKLLANLVAHANAGLLECADVVAETYERKTTSLTASDAACALVRCLALTRDGADAAAQRVARAVQSCADNDDRDAALFVLGLVGVLSTRVCGPPGLVGRVVDAVLRGNDDGLTRPGLGAAASAALGSLSETVGLGGVFGKVKAAVADRAPRRRAGDGGALIIMIVLGGLTFSEIRDANAVLEELGARDRVVLGGTRLCTGQDVAEALFFADDEDF